MKINFNRKVKKWDWIFNCYPFRLIGLLLFFTGIANGQNLTKVFEKEIEISQNATIVTNTPRSINMEMHGTMSFNNTADGFMVNGKNGDLVLKLGKDFEINTWDKNTIKQEVEITIIPEVKQEAQNLLNALIVNLDENAIGEVNVDCNMNLWKMELRNSFFSKDKTEFILSNGKRFTVKGLKIKTKLTIPKKSNLRITGEYTSLGVLSHSSRKY